MKVNIVYADDWQGIYIDGKLKLEGHKIELFQFADIIGLELEEFEASYKWLINSGRLPEDFSEVVMRRVVGNDTPVGSTMDD